MSIYELIKEDCLSNNFFTAFVGLYQVIDSVTGTIHFLVSYTFYRYRNYYRSKIFSNRLDADMYFNHCYSLAESHI